jgi:hypothetical protein
MSGTTISNGRDGGNAWFEGLLTGAGASKYANTSSARLAACTWRSSSTRPMLAALPADRINVGDVIKMMKFYTRGINDAKSR